MAGSRSPRCTTRPTQSAWQRCASSWQTRLQSCDGAARCLGWCSVTAACTGRQAVGDSDGAGSGAAGARARGGVAPQLQKLWGATPAPGEGVGVMVLCRTCAASVLHVLSWWPQPALRFPLACTPTADCVDRPGRSTVDAHPAWRRVLCQGRMCIALVSAPVDRSALQTSRVPVPSNASWSDIFGGADRAKRLCARVCAARVVRTLVMMPTMLTPQLRRCSAAQGVGEVKSRGGLGVKLQRLGLKKARTPPCSLKS
jgi:hypothetical protein